MIPVLYREDETNFNHNGIGILYDTTDYTVTEERNGPYELELIYPAGGRWADEIKDFRIISAKPNDEEVSHLFRIYEILKNLEEETITVRAATKSNDLGGNLVQNVSVENVSAQQALNAIKDGLIQPTSYNFVSNIETNSSGSWNNKSPLSAIIGTDGSVVSKWGGEIKRTDDTIYLYARRGTDKVTTIRQGKGLDGFRMTSSIKGLITTILPYVSYTSRDSEEPIVVKGALVDSALVANYPIRYITAVDFSQYSEIFPNAEGLTTEQYNSQLLMNLNTKAGTYFTYMNPGCDKPKVTVEVDLSQLSDSSEYERFRKLEHISLTDTVMVWVEKFNVDVEVTINEVTYNGMSERVTKFTAGTEKTGLIADSDKRYTEQIDKVVEYVNTVENGIYNTIRTSADAKNNIFSGYTRPDDSLVKLNDIWYKPVADGEIEMYRWDGDSWVLAVNNADKLVIGTIDGSVVNVVNINASNLSTGTITGASGGWNLNSGEFWLGSSKANSKLLWDGVNLSIRLGSGQTVEEYVGTTVASTDVEYYLSTSTTVLNGGSWSTIAPAWVNGMYMWTRTKVTYKNGTVQYRPNTNGVCIAGAKGEDGESTIPDITIGVRNLLIRNQELKDTTISTIDGSMVSEVAYGVMNELIPVTPGEVLTFSKTDSEETNDYWRYSTFDSNLIHVTSVEDSTSTFQLEIPEGVYFIRVSYPMDSYPKIERGNIATGWTPAPEDVDAMIYETATNVTTEFRTAIDVEVDSFKRLIETTYTSKEELVNYQQTVSTLLDQTSNSFDYQFTQVNRVINENREVIDGQFSEINRMIRMVDGNIVIGDSTSPVVLKLENDQIAMYVDDIKVSYWVVDGTGATPPKFYVTDGEFLNSLRLGSFAFTPRSNGNLSFNKV